MRRGMSVGTWSLPLPRSLLPAAALACCVLAGTLEPASASGFAPGGSDVPASEIADGCVKARTCAFEVVNGWDVHTRAGWFRELRSQIDSEIAPGAGAVFENIQDVLRLSVQKGFDDHGWFLAVDAGIIEAIQAGFALATGRGSSSPNWGSSGWQEFFDAFRNGEPPERLNHLWGTAEQQATNYGMHRARAGGHELGYDGRDDRIRFALIEVGNTYRQNLAKPSTGSKWAFWRVCNAPAHLLELITGFILRLSTSICTSVKDFFSVLGPSVILVLGGVAYDSASWLRPLAASMGLFAYRAEGLWDPSVAAP